MPARKGLCCISSCAAEYLFVKLVPKHHQADMQPQSTCKNERYLFEDESRRCSEWN